jgi:hypothetical protein
VRLCALAFADDVLLLSHTSDGLQRLVSAFEAGALKIGLRLNMGAGKTERFVRNAEAGTVKIASGAEILMFRTTSTSV